MLDTVIDINAKSVLSVDRINHLNRLARQAFKNANRPPTGDDDFIYYLQFECFAMDEVLEAASDINTFIDFFSHVNSAFELLIEKDPTAFRTYKILTGMFRVFSKHESVIDAKWNEARKVLSDIDLLEGEAIERRKGGEKC